MRLLFEHLIELTRPKITIQVAYVKKKVKSELSIYQVIQILSISAFDKTPISQLLNSFQINQNVSELQFNLFNKI